MNLFSLPFRETNSTLCPGSLLCLILYCSAAAARGGRPRPGLTAAPPPVHHILSLLRPGLRPALLDDLLLIPLDPVLETRVLGHQQLQPPPLFCGLIARGLAKVGRAAADPLMFNLLSQLMLLLEISVCLTTSSP